jgi:hypothetical protein
MSVAEAVAFLASDASRHMTFFGSVQRISRRVSSSASSRDVAYGIFNAALGVIAFPASLLAGLLWDSYVLFGSALGILANIGLLLLPLRR